MKKTLRIFFMLLLNITLIGCAVSCNDISKDEPIDKESTYVPNLSLDSKFIGGDLISEEDLYRLEKIELSPWDFVKEYEAASIEDNEYIYRCEKSYQLIISLGESWADTTVALVDLKSDMAYSLCRSSSYTVAWFFGIRGNRSFTEEYTFKSVDGTYEVTVKKPYIVEFNELRGAYTGKADHVNYQLFLNGEEILPNPKEQWTPDGYGYKFKYYKKPTYVLWNPLKNIFFFEGTYFNYSVYEKKNEYSLKNEKLYDYVYLYDCDNGKETILTSKDFERFYDGYQPYIYVLCRMWSPCGRYVVLQTCLDPYEGGARKVIFYDIETEELIYGGDVEITSYGYSGMFQHLAPPELDWEEAYAIIEANRGN